MFPGATCNAVENVSKEAVAELCGDKMIFADYDLDEETGKANGEEFEVSRQSLLIVFGILRQPLFMYSRNNAGYIRGLCAW